MATQAAQRAPDPAHLHPYAYAPKMRHLLQLLKCATHRAIVFCGTRASVWSAVRVLSSAPHSVACAAAVGGPSARRQTRQNVESFRRGETRVLLATTVVEEGETT